MGSTITIPAINTTHYSWYPVTDGDLPLYSRTGEEMTLSSSNEASRSEASRSRNEIAEPCDYPFTPLTPTIPEPSQSLGSRSTLPTIRAARLLPLPPDAGRRPVVFHVESPKQWSHRRRPFALSPGRAPRRRPFRPADPCSDHLDSQRFSNPMEATDP
jgi:hypothetical protein